MLTVSFKLSSSVALIVAAVAVVFVVGCCWLLLLVICLSILSLVVHPADGLKTLVAERR